MWSGTVTEITGLRCIGAPIEFRRGRSTLVRDTR